MNIRNGRRRFIAGLFYSIGLLGSSQSAFAKLPKCEEGEVVRNGWRARWNAKGVSVSTKHQLNVNQVEDAIFYHYKKEYRVLKLKPSDLINLSVSKSSEEDRYTVSIQEIPKFFETKTAKYEARFPIDYGENSGGK